MICPSPSDEDNGRYLDILAWYPKTDAKTFGGNKDIEFASNSWGMDELGTLRNAVACWENNGGKIGSPKTTIGSLTSSSPYDSPCFFAMPVLKGNYSDISKGSLWLAGDFAGEEGQAGKLWPKTRCEAYNWDMHYLDRYTKDCSDLDVEGDLA